MGRRSGCQYRRGRGSDSPREVPPSRSSPSEGRIRIKGPREGRGGLLPGRSEDRGREIALVEDHPPVDEGVVS